MPSEQELKLGDVEPGRTRPNRPRPKPRPPATPEGAKRLRPGNTVDSDIRSALKSPNGSPRPRTGEAVDAPRVEPFCLKGNLKRSNRRRPHPRRQDGRRNGECDAPDNRACQSPSSPGHASRFADPEASPPNGNPRSRAPANAPEPK